MIVFWILIGAGVIWLLKSTVFNDKENSRKADIAEAPVNSTGSDQPLDIAQKRLARGEITKEEYAEIKKTLSENN